MQNILFFLLCALLTGCHAGTSRPELPEMVEYSGPNASSLRTFIESIEVIKLDHRESITVGAYNAIRSDSNSFYVGDMLNGLTFGNFCDCLDLLQQSKQAAAEKGTLGMRISAEGYDAETASPAIAHISGTSDAGEAVDFCTALTLNASTRVQIDPGAYEVEIIAPINADGSMFEAPEPFKAVVKASGIAEVAKKMAFVPAREANGAASDAASKVAQAMEVNDGTIAENAAEVAAKNAAVAS